MGACAAQSGPAPANAPAGVDSAAPGQTPGAVVSESPPPPPAPSGSTPVPGSSRTPAAAGQMCGGIAGIACAERLYCAYTIEARCGAGDMSGTCKAIPEMCTMEFAPVCGCDDKTYASACVAGRSGVSVRQSGACPGDSGTGIAEGKLCGTRGVAGECAEGLYCAYRTQCGATDAGGQCTKKPSACPPQAAPVCGCDERTYDNACEAGRNGVSVAAKGACKKPRPN